MIATERAGTRRRRLLRGALGASALLMVLGGPALAVASQPGATAVITGLSNLHSISRWAYPSSEALVRTSPSSGARALGRLQFLTGDGQAEVYVALASEQLASGQTWIRVELPARPNGQTGWVPRAALGSLHVVNGYLLIDRHSLRATLFRDGRAVFSAPIGVGKPGTVTPAGQFYVTEKLRTINAPVYGPYALGTSAYAPTLSEWPGGGVVGIHGTDEPQLVPGRPSHGCIRMHNADIAHLWATIEVGTPIDIT